MREITLIRDKHGEEATEGSIVFEGDLIEGTDQRVKHVFYTLELPWRDNETDVSCIPAGVYPCKMKRSPSKGVRYHLSGTDPRTYIMIHVGNYPSEILGCILLGMSRGEHQGAPAVWKSALAVTEFERLMNFDQFFLVIQDT